MKQIRAIPKYFLWLIAALGSLLFCYLADRYAAQKYRPEAIASLVESRMNNAIKKASTDSRAGFFYAKSFPASPERELKMQDEYLLQLFALDSLIYWNSDLVDNPFLPGGIIGVQADPSLIFEHHHYYYRLFYTNKGGDSSAIVSVPIGTEYDNNNVFFSNRLMAYPQVKSQFQVLPDSVNGAIPVVDQINHKKAFYLLFDSNLEATRIPQHIVLAMFVIAIFCFTLFIHSLLRFLTIRYGWRHFSWIVLTLITLLLMLTRIFWLQVLPFRMSNAVLFSPQILASNMLIRSFGDLLFFAILVCWVLTLLRLALKHQGDVVRFPFHPVINNGLKVLLAFIVIVGIFTLTCNWGENVINDSRVSLNLFDFFSLDAFSILSFVIIILICFIILTGIDSCKVLIKEVFANRGVAYLFFALSLLLAVFINWDEQHLAIRFLMAGLIFVLLVFYDYVPFRFLNVLQTIGGALNSSTYIWAMLLSAIVAIIFTFYLSAKEQSIRKSFAQKKMQTEDFDLEMGIYDLFARLEADTAMHRLVTDTSSSSGLEQYILHGYLIPEFSNFDVHIAIIDPSGAGKAISTKETILRSYVDSAKQLGNETGPEIFYAGSHQAGVQDCYMVMPLVAGTAGQTTSRWLAVLFSVEPENNRGFFNYMTQLRSELDSYSGSYTYAKYISNRLQSTNSNKYKFIDTPLYNGEEFRFTRVGTVSRLIYFINPHDFVVVDYDYDFWYSIFTCFSYLLFIIFAAYPLYFFFHNSVVHVRMQAVRSQILNTPLRAKLNISFIGIALLSVSLTGWIVISFIVKNTKEQQQEYLYSQMNDLESFLGLEGNSSLEDSMMTLNMNTETLDDLLDNFSRRSDLGVNIYDKNGKLLKSNARWLERSDLISNLINPTAFLHLKRNRMQYYLQDEYLGNLPYISLYRPVRDARGNPVWFLNIPGLNSYSKQRQQISNILVTTINVGSFILLIAGVVALILSNALVRPLNVVSRRFKDISITGNEPIKWRNNDEIGMLVKEYNKMILRVEQLASSLADSEREAAWREIAMQIAHEIKNPLTPMKLQLQYLQKAIQENSLNTPKLIINTSNALLEQIENLNHIATEFSSFAKMPDPVMENLAICVELKSIIDFYLNGSIIKITYDLESMPNERTTYIYADKNFIYRIFNNLFQNAVQSIPGDREGLVHVAVRRLTHYIIISVNDNGLGIMPQHLEKIFQPYFTTKSSGTGIGLSMTKNMVEMMEGKVWVESIYEVGSTFHVQFPVLNIK